MPRTTLPTLAALLALAASLPGQGERRSRRRTPAPLPSFEHCTFRTASFASAALGREARYGIFLPRGYDAEENAHRRYPVVIWLHGMFEDHERFARRGGGSVLDRMLGEGSFPPALFVCPDGGRTKFWVNGLRSGRYEDYVVHDLLEHLRATYRVDDRREARAIMGVSMGGYGALGIAFRHPRRFVAVAAHSAAIFPPDPENLPPRFQRVRASWGRRLGLDAIFGDPPDKKLWQHDNPLWLAETVAAERLEGLAIYFDCGTRDRYGFQEPNAALHRILERRKIPHTFRLVVDGRHGWRSGYNRAQLPHSLAFVAAALGAARGRAGLEGLLGRPEGEPPDARKKPGRDRRGGRR